MRVLGISPLDKDSTVSFVEDGRVVFACAEERLSRVKMQDGFPERALALGFARTGWDRQSIDTVAYAFFDGEEESRLIQEGFDRDERAHGPLDTAPSLAEWKAARSQRYEVDRNIPIPGFDDPRQEFMPRKAWYKRWIYDALARRPTWDWSIHRRLYREWVRIACQEHRRWTRVLEQGLAKAGLPGRLWRMNHHDAHAANAFFASGFPEALIVSLDGYGSGKSGGVFLGGAEGVRVLHRFAFPNSLGMFYEHVTSGLGFRVSRHEGKIVGLAAYGRPEVLRDVLLSRFELAGGDIAMQAACNGWLTRALAQHFAKRDVAAAYQQVLELVACQTIRYWLRQTGMTRVCVSGGVHANVKLNQRIREIEGVEQVFVYPNMGDGGCATGAAMAVFAQAGVPIAPFEDVYFGPDCTAAECESALRRASLAFERPDGLEERIAALLSENRIVGRFAGRMEYGPRALGNRSILYPAQDPHVNQWLNHQLRRTEFMPFAPACLAEEATSLFRNLEGCEKTAEFMTITFDCTERMRSQCPAAVHVDGTARPQLVRRETNPTFHAILNAYRERTGHPAAINTSFNMHEEPIVCSPEDAVRAFLDGNLDWLALGPFLVPHPRAGDIDRSRRA